MSETNLFTYGWVNPVLAFTLSTLGCLLAILLAIKARSRAGRVRARLLVYATIALGGIGVFQTQFVAILGFGINGTAARYEPLTLLAALVLAVLTVGGALLLVSFGRPGTPRLLTASILIGLSLAGSHVVSVYAIRATGSLTYEPMRFIGSLALAMLAGCATLWFIVSLRGLRSSLLAASIAGAAICGTHYTAMSGVQTQPGLLVAVDASSPGTGLTAIFLIGPVVLVGAAVTAMLWFFTVGTSTVHDLRAIFDDPEHSIEIEQWMIDEVTTRIATGYRPSTSPLTTTRSGHIRSEDRDRSAPTTMDGDPTPHSPSTGATGNGDAIGDVPAHRRALPPLSTIPPSSMSGPTIAVPVNARTPGVAGFDLANLFHAFGIRDAVARTPQPAPARTPRPRSNPELAAVWGAQTIASAEPTPAPASPPMAPDRYPPEYTHRPRNTR